MDQQPEAVVLTPKRRFALRLPSRATVTKVALLGGIFGLGAYVGVKKTQSDCACEPDAGEQPTTTDN